LSSLPRVVLTSVSCVFAPPSEARHFMRMHWTFGRGAALALSSCLRKWQFYLFTPSRANYSMLRLLQRKSRRRRTTSVSDKVDKVAVWEWRGVGGQDSRACAPSPLLTALFGPGLDLLFEFSDPLADFERSVRERMVEFRRNKGTHLPTRASAMKRFALELRMAREASKEVGSPKTPKQERSRAGSTAATPRRRGSVASTPMSVRPTLVSGEKFWSWVGLHWSFAQPCQLSLPDTLSLASAQALGHCLGAALYVPVVPSRCCGPRS